MKLINTKQAKFRIEIWKFIPLTALFSLFLLMYIYMTYIILALQQRKYKENYIYSSLVYIVQYKRFRISTEIHLKNMMLIHWL